MSSKEPPQTWQDQRIFEFWFELLLHLIQIIVSFLDQPATTRCLYDTADVFCSSFLRVFRGHRFERDSERENRGYDYREYIVFL